jgi:DNA invertase Pin-like site-specific DNA recombinase
MINRTYGYCRISDKDQNEARQLKALSDAGVDERFIFIDKQSGKDFNRPQYKILKNALREGDLLIIKSIDRLGRNYKEILKEWQEITTDIKSDVRVLDMSLLDTTLHKDLLGTFISDLILQVLAYVAEQERQNIKQRQAEGIEIAKAKGKHLGRPKAQFPEGFDGVYTRWKNEQITAKKAMQELDLKPTTFYKLVGQHEGREKKFIKKLIDIFENLSDLSR